MSPLSACLRAHLEKLEGQAGFCAENLHTGQKICHGDRRFLSASTIKIPVLALYWADREKGHFAETEYLYQSQDWVEDSPYFENIAPGSAIPWDEIARQMIIISDNTATNLLIQRLGLKRIQAWLNANGFKTTRIERYMMDLEARAQGIDNWTSPSEMCRLMKKLVKGEVTEPGSQGLQAILQTLHQQQDLEKIPHFFSAPILVANKPGELPGTRSDVGYLHNAQHEIVMALFTDQLKNEATSDLWLATLAQILWRELTDS